MKLFLATGNRHKIDEVAAILSASGLHVEVLPPSVLGGMPEVVEDTGTFVGNARKKALALAAKIPAGALAIADDSGVCVDALGGAPGVESAYYAGKPADPAANTAKLLAGMRGVPARARGAAFHCCIVAANREGATHVFEGRCTGRVVEAMRGSGGFGYDPIFVPDGFEETYAEIPAGEKNRISHRGKALAKFIAWLKTVT